MEPADSSSGSGSKKFWGYSANAGDVVQLEALGNSIYEPIASTWSSSTPTFGGNYLGYYFEVTANLATLPMRFRKAGPTAGFWTGTFRVTVGGTPMETRSYSQSSAWPTEDSWLVAFWKAYVTTTATIRIRVAN